MNRELVECKSLVTLDYDGHTYRPGEWFKASAVDALTMGASRCVSLDRDYSTRSLAAKPAKKTGKRAYNRRDLTAETS